MKNFANKSIQPYVALFKLSICNFYKIGPKESIII